MAGHTHAERRGLYRKYHVERTDNQDWVGRKHDGCNYFVLDLTHDPFAVRALMAYADACRESHPLLAFDLQAQLEDGNFQPPLPWRGENAP
jgi:hypothetical protein